MSDQPPLAHHRQPKIQKPERRLALLLIPLVAALLGGGVGAGGYHVAAPAVTRGEFQALAEVVKGLATSQDKQRDQIDELKLWRAGLDVELKVIKEKTIRIDANVEQLLNARRR